ncbi:hypothetical protein ACFLXQ_09115, partial [Chloroflexota bacterium]
SVDVNVVNNQAIVTIADNDATSSPALIVTTDGPTAANVGDTVVYTWQVRHAAGSDGSPVSNINVYDILNGLTTISGGDANNNAMLDGNEVWTYSFSYTIKASDPNPLINIVTVSGADNDGDDVGASGQYSTAISGYSPELFVDKDGPASAGRGDTVFFTYTIINLSSFTLAIFDLDFIGIAAAGDGSPIRNITISDNIAGVPTYVSGDYNGNNQLDGNEAWVYTASYVVQESDPSPLRSQVSVQGNDLEDDAINATDSHQLVIDSVPPQGSHRVYLPVIFRNKG